MRLIGERISLCAARSARAGGAACSAGGVRSGRPGPRDRAVNVRDFKKRDYVWRPQPRMFNRSAARPRPLPCLFRGFGSRFTG